MSYNKIIFRKHSTTPLRSTFAVLLQAFARLTKWEKKKALQQALLRLVKSDLYSLVDDLRPRHVLGTAEKKRGKAPNYYYVRKHKTTRRSVPLIP